jgi:hypothetical protein
MITAAGTHQFAATQSIQDPDSAGRAAGDGQIHRYREQRAAVRCALRVRTRQSGLVDIDQHHGKPALRKRRRQLAPEPRCRTRDQCTPWIFHFS